MGSVFAYKTGVICAALFAAVGTFSAFRFVEYSDSPIKMTPLSARTRVIHVNENEDELVVEKKVTCGDGVPTRTVLELNNRAGW